MDKLKEMVKLQTELMARLKVKMYSEEQTQKMLFAICCELGEIGDEINWKPWKKTVKVINLVTLRTELIDVLHFALELCIMWGLDADTIFEIYKDKMQENHERQDRGY